MEKFYCFFCRENQGDTNFQVGPINMSSLQHMCVFLRCGLLLFNSRLLKNPPMSCCVLQHLWQKTFWSQQPAQGEFWHSLASNAFHVSSGWPPPSSDSKIQLINMAPDMRKVGKSWTVTLNCHWASGISVVWVCTRKKGSIDSQSVSQVTVPSLGQKRVSTLRLPSWSSCGSASWARQM